MDNKDNSKQKPNFLQNCAKNIKNLIVSIQDFQDEQETRRILNKEKQLSRIQQYNKKHAHEQSLDAKLAKERAKKDKFNNKPKDSLFGEIKF